MADKNKEKFITNSVKIGGNIKFDLKSYNGKMNFALSRISNKKTLENFNFLAENYFGRRGENMPEKSAYTLLVPGYINHEEVEQIAKFIGSINEKIPYSLLIFHGDYQMRDLPITPKDQAYKCLEVAQNYLKKVNLGNNFLLQSI